MIYSRRNTTHVLIWILIAKDLGAFHLSRITPFTINVASVADRFSVVRSSSYIFKPLMREIGCNSGMVSLGCSSANRRIFKQLGKIKRVNLLMSKDIGQSTEVAFVKMDSDDSIENVIFNANGTNVNGREIVRRNNDSRCKF